MASAFTDSKPDDSLKTKANFGPKYPHSESETEDEEVRINCIGGYRGVDDSDVNSIEAVSDDEGDRKSDGVVAFVTSHMPLSKLPLVRPKATTGQRLSPHSEGNENENDSDSPLGEHAASRSFGTFGAASKTSSQHMDVGGENSSTSSHEDSASDGGILADEETGDVISLNDVLESLGDALDCGLDESESSNVRYIGVMEDRVDFSSTRPKTKRVLSYNTLFALNADAGHSEDSPKRARGNLDNFAAPVSTTNFSLGPPALQDSKQCRTLHSIRDESPVLTSDDEELDRQLGEELGRQEEADASRDNTPVPLLTPPGSPLTIEMNGSTTTVCEWPSNLTVDSALQAVQELRPLSPASLETFERKEEDRVASTTATNCSDASTLTPMLRGIYVGMD